MIVCIILVVLVIILFYTKMIINNYMFLLYILTKQKMAIFMLTSVLEIIIFIC